LIASPRRPALLHNGPKVRAADARKFSKTGARNIILKSQAFLLHRTVNGTKRGQTGYR
jgi:hypothetical protein